jgi:hypothetical protein
MILIFLLALIYFMGIYFILFYFYLYFRYFVEDVAMAIVSGSSGVLPRTAKLMATSKVDLLKKCLLFINNLTTHRKNTDRKQNRQP